MLYFLFRFSFPFFFEKYVCKTNICAKLKKSCKSTRALEEGKAGKYLHFPPSCAPSEKLKMSSSSVRERDRNRENWMKVLEKLDPPLEVSFDDRKDFVYWVCSTLNVYDLIQQIDSAVEILRIYCTENGGDKNQNYLIQLYLLKFLEINLVQLGELHRIGEILNLLYDNGVLDKNLLLEWSNDTVPIQRSELETLELMSYAHNFIEKLKQQ